MRWSDHFFNKFCLSPISSGAAFSHDAHISSVVPIFIKNAFDLSGHRFVFGNQSHLSSTIEAYRTNILTPDKETTPINHHTFGVQLEARELANVIVGDYFIIRSIFADDFDVAAER